MDMEEGTEEGGGQVEVPGTRDDGCRGPRTAWSPPAWPSSRISLSSSSSPPRHCRSWAGQGPLRPIMLESMFDDVKRMDKRQFLYQVKIRFSFRRI